MSLKNKEPEFIWKTQKLSSQFKEIDCSAIDPYKDFNLEPTGHYVLIRLNFDKYCIEVGVVNKDHEIIRLFRGKSAQDIYTRIFQYEKKHHLQWFKEKAHIAYLGKELKKAEIALTTGNNAYYQE